MRFEIAGPTLVIQFLPRLVVMRAISLNDDLQLATRKVGIVRTNRVLTPEPKAKKAPVAKRRPQPPLGRGAGFPQRSCAPVGHGGTVGDAAGGIEAKKLRVHTRPAAGPGDKMPAAMTRLP